MHSGVAVAGILIGVIGVIIAVAVRTRWARPVGGTLLIVAVAMEVFTLSSHTGSGQAAGGGPTTHLPPTSIVVTTTPTIPSTSRPTPSVQFAPHLLAAIHPGNSAVDPVIKANTANKEFVRLSNSGTQAYHIGGWRISNGSVTYIFPVGQTLPGGWTLVVRTGPGTNTSSPLSKSIVLHWGRSTYAWPFPKGTIALRDAKGHLINTCRYSVPKGKNSFTC